MRQMRFDLGYKFPDELHIQHFQQNTKISNVNTKPWPTGCRPFKKKKTIVVKPCRFWLLEKTMYGLEFSASTLQQGNKLRIKRSCEHDKR